MSEDYSWLGNPLVTQHALHRKKVAAREEVSEYVLNNARLDVEKYVMDRLVYNLTTFVMSERLAPDVVEIVVDAKAEVPASWWQHLKRDHFPQWYTRRWPVVNEVVVSPYHGSVNIERELTYPASTQILPEDPWGAPVYVEVMGDVNWRDRANG